MVKEPVVEEGIGEEIDSGEETEGEDNETPTTPKEPANELKVVVVMKADNILLGVQAPECDPVYTTMKGDLAAALARIPGLIDEAKQRWADTPLYPKANLPEPPPAPAPAQTRTATVTQAAKSKTQPSMF